MARFNMAWLLGAGDPEIVLSVRTRYRFDDPDLFRSTENAEAFISTEPKVKASPKGCRLADGKEEGSVLTQRLILPSGKMKVSYHVPEGGKLYVWIMDESDTRLRDTHALTGAYQIDNPVEWQDGSIDKWVGKSVYIQFMLEGGTEVFGFAFEDVAATGDDTASIGPSDEQFVLPPRHGYLMVQNPPFVKSVQNARPFEVEVEDERVKGIRTGYQLSDPKESGRRD